MTLEEVPSEIFKMRLLGYEDQVGVLCLTALELPEFLQYMKVVNDKSNGWCFWDNPHIGNGVFTKWITKREAILKAKKALDGREYTEALTDYCLRWSEYEREHLGARSNES